MYKSLVEVIEDIKDTEDKGIVFIQSSEEDKFVSYSQLYKNSVMHLNNMIENGISKGNEVIFQLSDNKNS